MNTNQTSATLIASAIRDAERSKKWTAEKAGIPNTTFGRKLRGLSEFTVGEIARVAQALGRHPSDLLPSEFFKAAA